MSLNTIVLPDLVIAELYGDCLLLADLSPAGPPEPSPGTAADLPTARAADLSSGRAADPVETFSADLLTARPAPSGSDPAPAGATRAAESAGPGYPFLGNNQKQITILVQSPGSAFLPDNELAFLTKMLEACKLNMGDVAIVNHATIPVMITALRQQLEPSTLLLFGLEPVAIRLPINFPQFKIQAFDRCTYLYAPSLEELVQPTEEGKLLKSKLWVTLKTLFEL